MPSRRYYITFAPVEHINGKMAPVRVRCRNVQTEEEAEQPGFYYGYQKRTKPNTSRYAVRTRGRVLSANPYTAKEEYNQFIFSDSIYEVNYYKQAEPEAWERMLAEFRTQKKYQYPWNFAIAETIKNNGSFPQRWK